MWIAFRLFIPFSSPPAQFSFAPFYFSPLLVVKLLLSFSWRLCNNFGMFRLWAEISIYFQRFKSSHYSILFTRVVLCLRENHFVLLSLEDPQLKDCYGENFLSQWIYLLLISLFKFHSLYKLSDKPQDNVPQTQNRVKPRLK